MRVGDYVRTENGSFTKIKAICEQRWKEPECIYSRVLCEDNEIYEYPKYIKSSPNIIDLIEVGDYVNGRIVDDYIYLDKLGLIGLTELEKEDEKFIKSIVTKESMENVTYYVK